jgi:hypothetical protein
MCCRKCRRRRIRTEEGLVDFDKALFGHIGFTIKNARRPVMG